MSERFINFIDRAKVSYDNIIFFKYIRKMTLLLIIPLTLMCIVFYMQYSSTIKRNFDNAKNQAYNQSFSYVNNIFEEIKKIHSTIRRDSNYFTYSISSYEELLVLEGFETIKYLHNTMRGYLASHHYLHSIYLYSSKSDYVLTTDSGNTLNNFFDLQWYYDFEKTGSIAGVVNSTLNVPNKKPLNIISCYFASNEYGYRQIMVFNISCEWLSEMLIVDKSVSDEIYITNEENRIFYSSIPTLTGMKYEKPQMDKCSILEQEFSQNLNYICAYDETDFEHSLFIARVLIMTIFVFAIIVSFMLAMYFSMDFYTSLIKVAYKFDNVSLSDIDAERELKQLSKSIFASLTKKQSLESALVAKMTALRKSQIIALQTQINPHFIFNTLGLINCLILNISKGPCGAERAVSLLAELIRYTLHTTTYIVTLRDELEATKKFIEIEKIKLEDSFWVEWDVDEVALDVNTIKFVMHPIIENAISHGIKYLEDQMGLIKISVKIVDNILKIKISDNGPCLTEKRLGEIINSMEKGAFPEDKNIGLSNVNLRIKLLYGNDYGCSIAVEDGFTTVTVIQPIRIK